MILDPQQYICNLLKDKFIKISSKNLNYSLRSFAKKLGVSSSSISEFFNGKRRISEKKAVQFLEILKFPEDIVNEVKKIFAHKDKVENLPSGENPFKEIVLSKEQFEIMADWRYFVFVALLRTETFKYDLAWISKRLKLTVKEVDYIIKKLKELKIIEISDNGEIKDNKCCFRTSDDFPDSMSRERQIEGLNSAIEALKSRSKLQFGAFSTISASPKRLEESKGMIEDFLKRLSLFLHDGDVTEVLELQIQLFPRTFNES